MFSALAVLLRPKLTYIILCNTRPCTTILAGHSVVNVRIIFYLNFGLSSTAKADNKCTISNNLVYINKAFVQVKLKITLKYQNQYFCFGVVHRFSRPISGLPVDLVIIR